MPEEASRSPVPTGSLTLGRRHALGLLGAGVAASILAACSGPEPTGPSTAPSSVPPSLPAPPQQESITRKRIPTRNEIIATYQEADSGEFGLEVPGVKSALPDRCTGVTLTLDACGGASGSAVDEDLLSVLRDLRVPATLFVNYRWAKANPRTMEELVGESLFDVENHGTRHLPLSVNGRSAYGIGGTTSVGEVYDEIMTNQEFLREEYDLTCRYFRPGTAFIDETSAQICRDVGLTPVGFTVNLDHGATLPGDVVASRVAGFGQGDIGLGHFNSPASGTGAGLAAALPSLLDRSLRFTTLRGVC